MPIPSAVYRSPQYREAYAEGSKACSQRGPNVNPYRPSDVARYQGWADGYYDAWSARSLEVARRSVFRDSTSTEALPAVDNPEANRPRASKRPASDAK